MRTDLDSPWKEALEQYFPQFMTFFFPDASTEIAWGRGHTFLDTELQGVMRGAEIGRRQADKLVQVWRAAGEECWVLVHVEVQNQPDATFARRMYTYHYRLFDRHDRKVASLAILGDDRPSWRPQEFGYTLWGCEIDFRFPTAKLLDFASRWSWLEESDNPFATVVMAHLKAKETQNENEARRAWKFSLMRRLYDRGYRREDILNLYRFIDWVLELPDAAEEGFLDDIRRYEEAKQMPYVTTAERKGLERGLEQGLERGLEQGLERGLEQGLERGLEQGLERGLERGLEQGLERGLEQGLERGIEQGLERGIERGLRQAIRQVLHHRFGTAPADLLARLDRRSAADLQNLMDIAMSAASIESFIAGLATTVDGAE